MNGTYLSLEFDLGDTFSIFDDRSMQMASSIRHFSVCFALSKVLKPSPRLVRDLNGSTKTALDYGYTK